MGKNINFKTLLEDLNKTSRMLQEHYVYEDEEEMNPEAMEQEEMGMMSNKTDEIIDQIRQLALDGIQEYAEDVDNEYYQTYKKIWMMCDKCLSEKDKVEQ